MVGMGTSMVGASYGVMSQGRSQGRVPGVPEPLPFLFLTVILSQQECNGLSNPEILRFVLCLQ